MTYRLMLLCLFLLFSCDQFNIDDSSVGIKIKIPRAMPNKYYSKNDEVFVYQVRMLIDSIYFHSDNQDSILSAIGPFLVNVDEMENIAEIARPVVPPGIYNSISFIIRRPHFFEVIEDTSFNTRSMPSMIIDARTDSIDFTVKIENSLPMKISLSSGLNVESGADYSTTFFMDTKIWFPDGFDPISTLLTGQLEKNILSSVSDLPEN